MMNADIAANFQEGLCLLLEDQPVAQKFMQEILQNLFPELEVCTLGTLGETKSFLQARAKSSGKNISLALIDLSLPDGSGVETVRWLAQHSPSTISVVVTIYDDDARVFEALSAGASGYILKDEDPQIVAQVLKRISAGEPPLSPLIARKLVKYFHTPPLPEPTSLVPLTARETETLSLLAKGMTVGEAAASMKLSPQTVAGYVKIVYQKLHVSNRAEATREAIRRGLA